jgi:preprotein translocase SecE subunit
MATPAAANPGVFARLRTFMEEVHTEMTRKVTWPTREDLKSSTQVTLILLGVMAVIIFFYDKIFEIVVLGLLGLFS